MDPPGPNDCATPWTPGSGRRRARPRAGTGSHTGRRIARSTRSGRRRARPVRFARRSLTSLASAAPEGCHTLTRPRGRTSGRARAPATAADPGSIEWTPSRTGSAAGPSPARPGAPAPVFDPARGVQTPGRSRWRRPPRSTTWSRSRSTRRDEWGASSLTPAGRVLFRLRELIDAHRDELAAIVTSEHGKVLDDAQGEVARGLECVEFACGIPHLLKGSHSSEVSTGVDVHTVLQPVGVVAGITPFNFPVMVPLWMLANAHRVRERLRAEAVGEGPVGVAAAWPSWCSEAGFPDGVVNVVQGDAEAVDALLTHPDVDAVSFVGSTPVARHVYETGHPPRQAGAGARRGQEPHGRAARRRHRRRRRRRHLRRRTARRASAAWRSRSSSRSVRWPTRWSTPSPPRIPDVVVGPGRRARVDDGPAHHRASTATASRSYVDGAADEGARGRRRRLRRAATATASSSAARCSTASSRACGSTTTRSSGRCSSVVRVATVRRGASRSSTPTRTATASPCSPATAAPPGASSARSRSAWSGINVPIPVPVAWHSFGGWKASLFGDSADLRPRGRPLLHPAEGRHVAAGPTRRPASIDLGFPTNR